MKLFELLHIETGEIVKMTLIEILEEINRDRSDDWSAYNETDWLSGLDWTEYKLL